MLSELFNIPDHIYGFSNKEKRLFRFVFSKNAPAAGQCIIDPCAARA